MDDARHAEVIVEFQDFVGPQVILQCAINDVS